MISVGIPLSYPANETRGWIPGAMSRKLNWIDVLNDQALWQSREDLKAWFFQLAGRKATLLDGTIDSFEETLGYMRRQVANLRFKQPVDLLWLDTQLKTISLGLLHHQGSQEGAASQMPRFRARVKGLNDSDLLRAVKDTLLVQFAEYVGEQLDSESELVTRCYGIHRQAGFKPVAAAAVYPDEVEQSWLYEIAVLEQAQTNVSDVRRCTVFFAAAPKAKFCSDACRFAAFQIAKSVQEPSYLAEKQRRFRGANKKVSKSSS